MHKTVTRFSICDTCMRLSRIPIIHKLKWFHCYVNRKFHTHGHFIWNLLNEPKLARLINSYEMTTHVMEFYCLQSGHYLDEKLHCSHERCRDVKRFPRNCYVTCFPSIFIEWYGPWREKTWLCCMQTKKALTSLPVHAVWSAPLLFALAKDNS